MGCGASAGKHVQLQATPTAALAEPGAPGPTVVCVLGGPFAGKSVHCARIEKIFGLQHLNVGDLLRSEREKTGSEYGAAIEACVKEGLPVPPDLTVKLLRRTMKARGWSGGKYVLDGFPRTCEHLASWNEVVGGAATVRCALLLDCPEASLLARDDDEVAAAKRFQAYQADAGTLEEKLEAQGVLRRIDADQAVEDVWVCVQKMLDRELAKASEGAVKPKRMTILHFNDVYNVEPRMKEPVGGIARFVTRVKELQAESVARGEPEAVVLFSGDAFNPSMTSTVTKGKHMVPALNAIGIHTACYGNHDFDFGVGTLQNLAADNNFPWLISNVIDKATKRPLANGIVTRMMDFHGRKIGLLGLVEKEWLVTLATLDPEEVDYEDFCPCARRLAKQLKEEGADIVVALTHMRVPNDELLAHEVAEVDIILGGHDHHYDVKPVGPHGTWVLKSGTDFRDITALRLEFLEPGIKVLQYEHAEITSSIREDPAMKALADECENKVGAAMDIVLCETTVDLDARFSAIRTSETNMGNFVADVMRLGMKADLAVLNSGTLRADAVLEKGPFKMRDLVSLLPMLDELCLLELSGAMVLSVLENAVSQYPRLEGRFAQVSGVRFTFDAAQPGGQRVVEGSVSIGDEPLDLERAYTLVTKDYLRQGKDGFDVFKAAKCLADGEQAGILPTMVRDMFDGIAQLGGSGESQQARNASCLVDLGSVAKADGDDDKYCIQPQIEGRIVCLNGV